MGSVSVSSCRCCMFVSCVHHVAVLNAALCMTCSLLVQRCKRRPCRRLPHHYPIMLSVFMICRGKCACTEMLWMCVLYVSFRSKVILITFGCVAMGRALLFIVRSRLLVYSSGSNVNRVQVVLSGFSMILFCFVQKKRVCRFGCMYFVASFKLTLSGCVVSKCCVGFASLNVVCDDLNDCAWNGCL